ncbi:hypothetical protein H5410_026987 [Solanum commersonii]|uniref:RNase H family protein n=1 Tax=Solanum commersonii TaxID=4109 RepID=A0A9J5Z0N7_SOLCO|nr:hypothetical protein H5410_026987 [Solanum commersonii]
MDKALRMLNSTGKFSVRSVAWERLWKKRLPVGEVLSNGRIANFVVCQFKSGQVIKDRRNMSSTWSDMPPIEGAFICNTDGACKDSFGLSSGAYCVRNDAGRFRFVQTRMLGYCTNLVVEFKAFRPVKKILEGLWETPWNVAMEVRKICKIDGRGFSCGGACI